MPAKVPSTYPQWARGAKCCQWMAGAGALALRCRAEPQQTHRAVDKLCRLQSTPGDAMTNRALTPTHSGRTGTREFSCWPVATQRTYKSSLKILTRRRTRPPFGSGNRRDCLSFLQHPDRIWDQCRMFSNAIGGYFIRVGDRAHEAEFSPASKAVDNY
jgi:hypothetical protein